MVTVYSQGLFCLSVCSDESRENTKTEVNKTNPSGTTMGWEFSLDPTFKGGEDNPCPCDVEGNSSFLHYLMEC